MSELGVAPRTNSSAIASLVVGGLSFLSVFGCCCIAPVGGIIAVALGRGAKRQIQAAPNREGGAALATTGEVMGWASIVLGVALMIMVVLYTVLVVSVAGSTNVVHQPVCFGC
jgi:hypothetical protein